MFLMCQHWCEALSEGILKKKPTGKLCAYIGREAAL